MFNANISFKLFIVVSQFTLTYFAISMDRNLQDIKEYITIDRELLIWKTGDEENDECSCSR